MKPTPRKKRSTKARRNFSEGSTPSTSRSTITRKYTDLHEGRPPDRILKDTLPKDPKYFVELGPIPELMYWKKTPEKNPHLYRHEFAEWARPTLVHDEKGKLHVVDQDKLIVTERGIEDMKKSKSISRANPSHAGNRFLARKNPFDGKAVKKVALTSGVVGLGVGAVMIGTQYAYANVAMIRDLTQNGYAQAGIQAGAGIGLALLAQRMGWELPAAILGVGGVASGTLTAWRTYQMQQVAAMAANVAAAERARLAAQTPAVTPAGSYGAVPQYGYAAR